MLDSKSFLFFCLCVRTPKYDSTNLKSHLMEMVSCSNTNIYHCKVFFLGRIDNLFYFFFFTPREKRITVAVSRLGGGL